ncbi:chemoreceptor glutamine deamidase CheD [Colwellia sp. BRX8-9]|uniref:chemoreceptor glutamine deamidase CheD n=1 Tax=Colwellia sp. BRX8-9 TaxID=2759831 RepID=UPI0015F55830|nr:chemoreceptor glutamine deamidase CheD [Colwellia sp. BRX8-9]MBA6349845.1 chemoreceptor glutamine deamidase CheD [Colwellia sp. BRX8-9]
MERNTGLELEQCISRCLPEFSHVNHYWDNQKKSVVAKILPGEFYMTRDNVNIATTLGSCIAACIWDKQAKIGGMNHFMLPLTDKKVHEVNWGHRGITSDATRYGNFAMEHLINAILKNGGRRSNLAAKIFGGGKVLKQMSDIGQRNIEFAIQYLQLENIEIESTDLGNMYPRKVIFEPASGRAFVKKLDNLHNDTIAKRERDYSYSIDHFKVDGDVELF